MSNPYEERAINELTAATLVLAEAQYEAQGYDPRGKTSPDQIVEEQYRRWLEFVLATEGRNDG